MTLRSAVLTAVLLASWTLRGTLQSPEPVLTAESLQQFPVTLDGWHSQDAALDEDVLEVTAVTDYLNRQYRSSDGREIGLYVGYYQRQRQGEALHSPLFCLPGAGWQPTKTEDLRLPGAADQSVVKKLVVERGLDRLLVLYWYQTFHRVTGSEYARKLFLMYDAFITGRTDVALVRVIAPLDHRVPTSESDAVDVARPFAERVRREVGERLFRP
jgi:EpsI family protein